MVEAPLNILKKSLVYLLCFQLITAPTFAKEHEPSEKEILELLKSAAELEASAKEATLALPLFEELTSQALSDDTQKLLLLEQYRDVSLEKSARSRSGIAYEDYNTVQDKFRWITVRVALDSAIRSWHFYSSLAQTRFSIQSLPTNSRKLIEERYPALLSIMVELEANTYSRSYEVTKLQEAVAQALLHKGLEIGALTEKSSGFKLEIAQIELSLPETSDMERPAKLAKKEELGKMAFTLDTEVDRRLSEQTAYTFLTQDYGNGEPLFQYIWQQQQSLLGANGKINLESREVQLLEAQIKRFISKTAGQLSQQTVAFITAATLGKDEVIAPLVGLRMQALEMIDIEIQHLSSQGLYKSSMPQLEAFVVFNNSIERQFGFDFGRYNAYTAQDFLNVIIAGMVAAELVKLAAHVPALKSSTKAIQSAARAGMKHTLKAVEGAGAIGRGAGQIAARTVGVVGRFANPVIFVGTSLPLLYEFDVYITKKNYRTFLKNYLPSAYVTGNASYNYATFSEEVDDSMVEIIAVSEAIMILFLANRFKTHSWSQSAKAVSSNAKNVVALGTQWSRWKNIYQKSHIETLMAMLATATQTTLSAAGTAGRAITGALKPSQLWRLMKSNSSKIAFVGGSLTMAADAHLEAQGYGHLIWLDFDGLTDPNKKFVIGSIRSTFERTNGIGEFFSSMLSQFKSVWETSEQAQIDLLSIGLSEVALTYSAENPKMNMVQIAHFYSWVSIVSDVGGQVFLSQTREGNENKLLEESVEEVDWARALIHYSFVATFSTWKYLYLYVPLLDRATKPLVRRYISGNAFRVLQTASRSHLISRRLALKLSQIERGTSLWTATYLMSLVNNWVGNTGFILIAGVMKKNSSDVPPPLVKELKEKVMNDLAGYNIEWTSESIRQLTQNLESEIAEIKALKAELAALTKLEQIN